MTSSPSGRTGVDDALSLEVVRVVPQLAIDYFTMDQRAAIAKVLITYAGQFFNEVVAEGEKREALKRSGLYYLLRLQTYQSDHAHEG